MVSQNEMDGKTGSTSWQGSKAGSGGERVVCFSHAPSSHSHSHSSEPPKPPTRPPNPIPQHILLPMTAEAMLNPLDVRDFSGLGPVPPGHLAELKDIGYRPAPRDGQLIATDGNSLLARYAT